MRENESTQRKKYDRFAFEQNLPLHACVKEGNAANAQRRIQVHRRTNGSTGMEVNEAKVIQR